MLIAMVYNNGILTLIIQ